MRKMLVVVLMLALVPAFAIAQAQSQPPNQAPGQQEGAAALQKDIQDLESRLEKVEKKSATAVTSSSWT